MTRRVEIYDELRKRLYVETDRIFGALIVAQWIAAVVLGLVVGRPLTALGFGALIVALPLALIHIAPARATTRHAIAVAQLLWSALLVSLVPDHAHTQLHMFASFALLLLYRDWTLIATATLVALASIAAGALWGAPTSHDHPLELAGWLTVASTILAYACVRGQREVYSAALLEQTSTAVERKVVERTAALQELQQAQKLESVGRLAAGVAHEINTPIQFVGDSVEFVRTAMADVTAVMAQQRAVVERVLAAADLPDAMLAIARDAEALFVSAEVPYLFVELPRSLERACDGIQRVADIVRSMKTFAHPDKQERVDVDLNHAIESTLTIARNEYRYVADLETHFGPLPPVRCHAGEINQVILNIVVNAAHAIGDVVAETGGRGRGRITVTTQRIPRFVEISITDTGGGIPDHIQSRIFDPFFTTKDVDRGTGQGLAIARSVIVDKYGGSLTFETAIGSGTTFRVRIPIGLDSSEIEAAA